MRNWKKFLEGPTRNWKKFIEEVTDKEFLIANALVRVGDVVPVRIMNVKETPIKLDRRTVVGQCAPVSSICCVTSTDKPSKSKYSKELIDMVNNSCQDLDNEQTIEN